MGDLADLGEQDVLVPKHGERITEENEFLDCLYKVGDLGDLGEQDVLVLKQEERVTEENKFLDACRI